MLDAPPKEPEWRSWLYAAVWSCAIFCTIPFANTFGDIVKKHIGLDFFLYATVAVLWLLVSLSFPTFGEDPLP